MFEIELENNAKDSETFINFIRDRFYEINSLFQTKEMNEALTSFIDLMI
ncbi:hypothetical protein [Clostridium sp. JN-9]|nr:hypothetical protein [Clostridium sp. JN-9]